MENSVCKIFWNLVENWLRNRRNSSTTVKVNPIIVDRCWHIAHHTSSSRGSLHPGVNVHLEMCTMTMSTSSSELRNGCSSVTMCLEELKWNNSSHVGFNVHLNYIRNVNKREHCTPPSELWHLFGVDNICNQNHTTFPYVHYRILLCMPKFVRRS